MKQFLLLLLSSWMLHANGQNLGGFATYNFLRLPAAPLTSALGGNVVAITNEDPSLIQSNPALGYEKHHKQLAVNANFMYAGIKHIQSNYSTFLPKLKTTANLAVSFINYGKTNQTDAMGNSIGTFYPNDYSINFSLARKYLQKWSYGTTIKAIGSNYGPFKSFAIALDMGLTFFDSAKSIKAGMVFKNIGFQLKKYNNAGAEALPFDFQVGISKKLEKAPLQFIFTATNLHQFDIRYNDTLFEMEMNGVVKKGKFTIDKLFRHFIFGAQVYPSKYIELTIAYNYLRRKELGLFNIGNGMTGFSFGAGILFNSYQFRFAKAFYQNARAYNQIGFQINFDKLMN